MTPPDFDDFMPLTPISSGMESTACHRLQANVLNDMLWSIYFSIFEMRYAIWLGDSCCPYLEMTPVSPTCLTDPTISLNDLFHRNLGRQSLDW